MYFPPCPCSRHQINRFYSPLENYHSECFRSRYQGSHRSSKGHLHASCNSQEQGPLHIFFRGLLRQAEHMHPAKALLQLHLQVPVHLHWQPRSCRLTLQKGFLPQHRRWKQQDPCERSYRVLLSRSFRSSLPYP